MGKLNNKTKVRIPDKIYCWLLFKIQSSILIISFFLLSCAHENHQVSLESENNISRDSLLNTYQFQNGDIVLRKGNSIESETVSLLDNNGRYSHIGIVKIENDTPFVIHIVPDSIETNVDYCLKQEINTFYSVENARYGSVLRLQEQNTQLSDSAAQRALKFYQDKVSFDEKYNLGTDQKMYCTELVWKAYRINQFDIIKGKISVSPIPLFRNKIILPSAFLNSGYLKEIYYF
jgi:hypothetical protein